MDKELKLKWRKVIVPSAAVKTLVATDVEIVEAPGAGRAYIPIFATITLDFNTTAYAWANTDHGLTLGTLAADSDAEAQALIESTDRFTIRLQPGVDSAELAENTAINLTASGTGEPATGNSDLIVSIVYAEVDVTE